MARPNCAAKIARHRVHLDLLEREHLLRRLLGGDGLQPLLRLVRLVRRRLPVVELLHHRRRAPLELVDVCRPRAVELHRLEHVRLLDARLLGRLLVHERHLLALGLGVLEDRPAVPALGRRHELAAREQPPLERLEHAERVPHDRRLALRRVGGVVAERRRHALVEQRAEPVGVHAARLRARPLHRAHRGRVRLARAFEGRHDVVEGAEAVGRDEAEDGGPDVGGGGRGGGHVGNCDDALAQSSVLCGSNNRKSVATPRELE